MGLFSLKQMSVYETDMQKMVYKDQALFCPR